MGVFDVSYCTSADLRSILPTIASYDKKRLLTGWSLESGSIYQLGSTGEVSMLYRDKLELGTAQVSKVACDADGKWYYDSAADVCYVYSTAAPKTHKMEAGTDYTTLETAAIVKGSELVRSIVLKSIVPKPGGTYDQVIVMGTAAIAVGILVRPYDIELADSLERKYNNYDEQYPLGLLQLVNEDKISLHNEIHPSLGQGVVIEQSLDDATTGGILDIKGLATDNDTVKVIIDTGGTFSYGSASTITHSTWIKDSTGLMTLQYISSDTVNGDYQEMAHGLELQFIPGVYVAEDTWYIKVSREPVETHQSIRTIQLTKR